MPLPFAVLVLYSYCGLLQDSRLSLARVLSICRQHLNSYLIWRADVYSLVVRAWIISGSDHAYWFLTLGMGSEGDDLGTL